MSIITNAAAILFKRTFSQKIGRLEIDIVEDRTITEKVTITRNPVGNSFITDNARDEPTEISIVGEISAFSLKSSLINNLFKLSLGDTYNRLKEAHDELYRIKNEKKPISIVSKYKTYENMILLSLSFFSKPGDGETLRFSCVFQEVRIAESQLVNIPNSKIKVDTAKNQTSFGREVAEVKDFEPQPKLTLIEFFKSLFQ